MIDCIPFKIKLDYNFENDIFKIKLDNAELFDLKESLEISEGVFLDLDKTYFPISLRITNISERVGLKYEDLLKSKVRMKILNTNEIIEIFIIFIYESGGIERESYFNSKIANRFNIPSRDVIFSSDID